MTLSILDLSIFIAFLVIVIVVSLYASRKEETTEDYFLAGRGLNWWLIGMSLIASNISTEHFVGMAGKGFELGLAIASYEWMAAVTLIVVALFLLPRFLKAGIYTIPEFLEYRYNGYSRSIMAFFMLLAYVFVALASVLYSGAIACKAMFGMDITFAVWLIGITAGVYTVYGGLKAVVWSDLIQGIALLLGGLIVTILCFQEIGGVERFFELSKDKLHTVLPWNHPEMPWVAIFIGGLWIPNFFYWGLNQFITQRTLAAKSLVEGQRGIIFAAFLKLFVPFIIVFPGIIAFELYGNQIDQADGAYPYLIKNLLPEGLKGLILAALFGAIMSSLDSMLNSASTIFTIDIYQKFIKKDASQQNLVKIGRIVTAVLVVQGCLWAPFIENFGSVFEYIQKVWGFISPGIVAVFVFGILWNKVRPITANISMFLNIPIYAALLYFYPEVAFLHHMSITFILICIYIVISSFIYPYREEIVYPVHQEFTAKTPLSIKLLSGVIVLLTVMLYVIFY